MANEKRYFTLVYFLVYLCSAPMLTGMAAYADQTELRVAYHGPTPVSGIDTHRNIFSFQSLVLWNVFEPLFARTGEDNIVLRAARSFAINDKVVEFRLREGMVWSDGTPLGAEDFVKGFMRGMHPDGLASNTVELLVGGSEWVAAGGKGPFSGLTAPDALTLRVEFLSDPQDMFRVMDHALPFPAHLDIPVTENWGAHSLISNGPFVISPTSTAEEMVLTRNPTYSGADPAYYDQVAFYNNVQDTVLPSFMSGKLDLILDVPWKQLGWVGMNQKERFAPTGIQGLFVGTNTRGGVLADAAVRRALSTAINREELSETISGGLGGALYVPTFPGMTSLSLEAALEREISFEERLMAGTAMLADLGYDQDNPLKVKLGYFDILTFRTMALGLAHSWRSIGVEVELVSFSDDFGLLMQAAQSGELDAYIISVSPAKGLLFWLQRFADGEMFSSFYKNATYNGIIRRALASEDEARTAALTEAERHIWENVVSIPLSWFNSGALVSSELRASFLNLGNQPWQSELNRLVPE